MVSRILRKSSSCSLARFDAIIAFLLYAFTLRDEARRAYIETSPKENTKIHISTSIMENPEYVRKDCCIINSPKYVM